MPRKDAYGNTLTTECLVNLETMARDWAEHEFDCFIEQGRDYRAWTPGEWSGRQLSDADERTLDKLAAEHWETLWDTKAHGSLHDYLTGAFLRPATKAEREASDREIAAGHPEGVINVGDRACFVQE